MSFFGNRLKYVACKTWDATDPAFQFPELGDPELKVPDLEGKAKVGLAFSGGGTRSGSATLGQLRGLQELGLLNQVGYISCVSGGAWTVVPYTYLPSTWTDEAFLGQVIAPRDVTRAYLQKTDRNSFTHALANSVIVDDILRNAARFAGDETYSRALGDVFLLPFGIDSLERFFSLNEESVSAIIARHRTRGIDIRANDFYQIRAGRPYLIVNSIIIRTENQPPLPQRIHFETTPLYVGSRVLHPGAGSNGRDIGGGYIEPLGFDSSAPEQAPDQQQTVSVRLGTSRHRYSLSDVMGTTGAAPAEVLAQLRLDWVGLPEFNYWPPVNIGQVQDKEYNFGDGGILENLGIMPLLMRKVERIVVFINTKDKLTETNINTSLPPLFGQTPGFEVNHVFPAAQYQTLVQGLLAAKRSGQTVMFQDQYQVRQNQFYGIEGNWNVEVLWVYNERVPAWERLLRADIRRMIGTGSLGNFPHYKTIFQNPPTVIDLSATQVSMLAHLSAWNVIENETVFRGIVS